MFSPIETVGCSYCSPHIPSNCCESKPFMFDSFDPITSSFASAALAGTAETRKLESNLYDSGALRHMMPFKDQLINYTPITSYPITATDKQVFHAVGKGDMRIRIPNGSTITTILWKDVLYTPAMGVTIISVSHVTAAGFAVLF